MNLNESVIGIDEKAIFDLRSLYRRYGYTQYKMSKFEEYDFYVRNKDFLTSDRVITFTDTNGKLMALKPDVTFSIIKNTTDTNGYVQKVYYNENVYRVSKGTNGFREIIQTGLECIGDTDLYNICEVLMLAAKSLGIISNNYILDISHMGFIEGLLDGVDITAAEKEAILKCLGEKNAHEIEIILKDKGSNISSLTKAYGKADDVIEKLKSLSVNEKTEAALNELLAISKSFKENKMYENIRLDFSVINNMNYYNGLVFQGFIDKIPTGVLSGGQYDKLMHKMGKKAGAIGFAVYLDYLQRFNVRSREYDVDALIIYDEKTDIELINKTVSELTKKGEIAMAQKSAPQNIKYRRIISLREAGK